MQAIQFLEKHENFFVANHFKQIRSNLLKNWAEIISLEKYSL